MATERHSETREEPGVRGRRVLRLMFGLLGGVAVLFGVLKLFSSSPTSRLASPTEDRSARRPKHEGSSPLVSEWRAEAHEDPGVRTRRVLWLIFGFLGGVAVLFGVLNFYYRSIILGHVMHVSMRQFPAPQLQPNPTQDYANFRAAQLRQLSLSGPAGGKSTLVRVPIDAAMAIVAARGAAAYDPVAGTPPTGPALATGATMDGAPRATPGSHLAPYGVRP